MERIRLSETLEISRIIHGHGRMNEWGYNDQERLRFLETVYQYGITTIDTADTYGEGESEILLGRALRLNPSLRTNLQIITKCGIVPKTPDRLVKYYDLSFDHIINSVYQSLKRIGTDYLDLFLLHRQSPFVDYEAIARAFNYLYKEGIVLNFGVANFQPQAFNTLQKYLKFPLLTNLVEISPLYLEPFHDGTIDLCLEYEIPPLAASPLCGGALFLNDDFRAIRLRKALEVLAKRHQITLEQVVYAWLFSHPAKIIPILGTGKIERIKLAVDVLNLRLTTEEWFYIYEAGLGHEVY